VALRLAVDDFDGGRPLPLPRCLTGAALELVSPVVHLHPAAAEGASLGAAAAAVFAGGRVKVSLTGLAQIVGRGPAF
jgi:hypothetical protein